MKALSWAVKEAAGWRGSLTGNPDPRPLAAFDANIATAEEAIKDLRRTEKRRKEIADRAIAVITELQQHEGAEGFSAGLNEKANAVIEALSKINK